MVSLGIVQADKEMVSEELYMSVDEVFLPVTFAAVNRKNTITTDNIMVTTMWTNNMVTHPKSLQLYNFAWLKFLKHGFLQYLWKEK